MLNTLPFARLLFYVLSAIAVLGQACAMVAMSLLPDIPAVVWMALATVLQLMVIGLFASYIDGLIGRSIACLTEAAGHPVTDHAVRDLPEKGPKEMVQAVRAFKTLNERLVRGTAERIEVLAAISHDLQTPITRMRLRAEMLESKQESTRLLQDLDTMHALVKEGVTYARTLHGTTEPPSRIDLRALLESIVSDYEDSGDHVSLESRIEEPVITLPNAFRRILANLVDNALKFGSAVRIHARKGSSGLVISVLDNGPGIRPDQLENVFRPFYRGELRGDRDVVGSGLGLAIARQLAIAMNADLRLYNRNEGGLEARLTMNYSPGVEGSVALSHVTDGYRAGGFCPGRAVSAMGSSQGAADLTGLLLSSRR
ncbi:sensor histidine kinase [Caballeronia sp. DA-9]|uniref:sensor histidine kinase n=1 Tax=Caballeronia sp. DA-9 TaxID=3436237 RepID=UPI003F6758F6